MFTTLNQIRAKFPCATGWKTLLAFLNKTQADDDPINIATIIDSNGLDDAIWCLRAVNGKDKEIRLYVVWCARQVQHLMPDKRSRDAIDVAERFANGEATQEELNSARDAAYVAWGASSSAAYAAGAAVWCVALPSDRAAAMPDYSNASLGDIQEAHLREICQ